MTTPQLIGLAGPAGAGKDALAESLERRHGWAKFSFSDALYREVAEAFRVPESYLRDPEVKDALAPRLALARCRDDNFVRAIVGDLSQEHAINEIFHGARSPRWILQRWGTDYRRRQDPQYWIKRAAETLEAWRSARPGERPPGLANTSVRFDNELAWVRSEGGIIVHIARPGYAPESDYISEQPLPVADDDIPVVNNGTIRDLDETADAIADSLSASDRRRAS